MIRATLFVAGRVQGVGFRYATNEIAKKFDVKGTVENCEDGRVMIVVEAESKEIDDFVEAIQALAPGKINRMDRFESEPSHAFDNFSIRR